MVQAWTEDTVHGVQMDNLVHKDYVNTGWNNFTRRKIQKDHHHASPKILGYYNQSYWSGTISTSHICHISSFSFEICIFWSSSRTVALELELETDFVF